ncbi:hypothetical protein HON01_00885, partial [Candidatus Woesearchaeota archaeon]|nr:hypothetical protein [Candidatus Woesearchaeota archaeon]
FDHLEKSSKTNSLFTLIKQVIDYGDEQKQQIELELEQIPQDYAFAKENLRELVIKVKTGELPDLNQKMEEKIVGIDKELDKKIDEAVAQIRSHYNLERQSEMDKFNKPIKFLQDLDIGAITSGSGFVENKEPLMKILPELDEKIEQIKTEFENLYEGEKIRIKESYRISKEQVSTKLSMDVFEDTNSYRANQIVRNLFINIKGHIQETQGSLEREEKKELIELDQDLEKIKSRIFFKNFGGADLYNKSLFMRFQSFGKDMDLLLAPVKKEYAILKDQRNLELISLESHVIEQAYTILNSEREKINDAAVEEIFTDLNKSIKEKLLWHESNFDVLKNKELEALEARKNQFLTTAELEYVASQCPEYKLPAKIKLNATIGYDPYSSPEQRLEQLHTFYENDGRTVSQRWKDKTFKKQDKVVYNSLKSIAEHDPNSDVKELAHKMVQLGEIAKTFHPEL